MTLTAQEIKAIANELITSGAFKKFSEFDDGVYSRITDQVVGLRSGVNTKFNVGFPPLYSFGGDMTTDGDHMIFIASLACADSTNNYNIFIPADQTDLDATVAGLNGLDVLPLAASQIYTIYAIEGTSGSGTILSLNPASPTLPPAGYNRSFRRRGTIRTDPSALLDITTLVNTVGSMPQSNPIFTGSLSGPNSSIDNLGVTTSGDFSGGNIFRGINTYFRPIVTPTLSGTLTAAMLLQKNIILNPASAGLTATLDSATNILNATLFKTTTNNSFNSCIVNVSVFDILIAAGADTVLNGMPGVFTVAGFQYVILKAKSTLEFTGTFTGTVADPPLVLYFSGGSDTSIIPVNVTSSTGFTLANTDIATHITTTAATTVTVTVPASIYQSGQWTEFFQSGAGQISFVAAGGSGITFVSKLSNTKTSVSGSPAFLYCRTTTVFEITGDLSI